MKHFNKIVMATILAGSMGLAGLGISRAQTTDPASSSVDKPITTAAVNAVPPTSTSITTQTHAERHAQRLADKAAKLGMTSAELQAAIDSGKPMYQIAAEHGVTYATEKVQRLADLKTRLDDMVKVKYLTQAEADEAYKAAQDNPMVGMGRGFGGHGLMR